MINLLNELSLVRCTVGIPSQQSLFTQSDSADRKETGTRQIIIKANPGKQQRTLLAAAFRRVPSFFVTTDFSTSWQH